MSVVIETTLGDITVDLYLEQRPRTCLNFLKLCKIKYYNLSVFHKVERNFIAQTGDPTETGRGGESIFCRLYGEQAKYFDAELKPRLKHEKLGTLSMVNNGNNMNGAQFFITLGENLTYLDEVHTVFGEVAEGFETLLKINEAICDPNDRPYQDIRITHTVILHDSYEDPTGLDVPPTSPIPTKEQLQSNYIGADEEIDDTKGKNMEEIEEKIKESEAKARATILEMVGDIPDADVKPPENVLFVCKLNPVTTSEDLEVIFSRFGSIVSCEVIKDRKTDESLQYAFIEFENEEDCESAYFKMDNVLIDDRRIHVDFSQSVSKMKFEHSQSQKKQNLVLKDKTKNQDNYDMIFDLDDNNAPKEVVHSQKEKQKKIINSMQNKKDCRPNSSQHSDDMSNYKKSKNSKSDSRTNRSCSRDRQSRYGNSMHGSKKEKSHFSRTSELKQFDSRHKTKVTEHRPKSYSSNHTLKVSMKPHLDAKQLNYKEKKRSSSVSSSSSSSNKDYIKKSAKKLNIEKSSDRATKKQKPQQQYSSSSSDSSSSSSSSSPSKKSKKKSSDVSKKKKSKKRYSSSSSDSSTSSSSTSDSSTVSEKNSKRSKTKCNERIPKSTQSDKHCKTKEESMESHHSSKKHKIHKELKYCYNDSDTLLNSSSVPQKREERSRARHYDEQSYHGKARSRSSR